MLLADNQLKGRIPPEIGGLVSADTLYLSRNNLSGPIPNEVGNLESLVTLALFENQLTGPLPASLGKLKRLEELILSDNRIDGPLPGEIGEMTSLAYFSISRNRVSGPIPPELGRLKALEHFSVNDNRMVGPISPELGDLTSLEDLLLPRNGFSGAIPPELGRLPALTSLGLCESGLSGPILPEIGDIRTLESLSLCYNPELSGLLPRVLMKLESLSEFPFYGTGLCPQIDSDFRAWLAEVQAQGGECDPAETERLALGAFFARTGGDAWTRSTGWKSGAALDDWHGVTTGGGRVREIALPANGLRGPLAPEIANLTGLRILDLGDNDLSGGFPAVVGSMADLETIRVSGNREMEGRLPFRLTELKGLGTLTFANTGLCASPSGTFQEWMAGLRAADGATCGNPEEVTLSLPVVDLTQGIQRPAGDVPLIRGRDALLRVFLKSDESEAFFDPEVAATLSVGGQEVHHVVMRRDIDLLAAFADESDLRHSYNAVIPGSYIVPGTELVVEADPGGLVPLAPGSQTRFPASGSEPLKVIGVPPMQLTVVPFVEAVRPDSSVFEWTDSIGDESPEVGRLPFLRVPRQEPRDLRHLARPDR